MAACSAEELSLFNNLTIRKQYLEKPRLLLENCLPLDPILLRISVALTEVEGFGYFLELKYIVRRSHR